MNIGCCKYQSSNYHLLDFYSLHFSFSQNLALAKGTIRYNSKSSISAGFKPLAAWLSLHFSVVGECGSFCWNYSRSVLCWGLYLRLSMCVHVVRGPTRTTARSLRKTALMDIRMPFCVYEQPLFCVCAYAFTQIKQIFLCACPYSGINSIT